MTEQGLIQFTCVWVKSEPFSEEQISEVNSLRRVCHELGFVGVYETGIGYGNVSVRIGGSDQFIISGTQTGMIPDLDGRHYALVRNFDIDQNKVWAEGPIKPSAESLSHAACYLTSPQVGAVAHIHHLGLWQELRNKAPTTVEQAQASTPEIAREILRLFVETDLSRTKLLVMAGHDEGLMVIGDSTDEVQTYLSKLNERL